MLKTPISAEIYAYCHAKGVRESRELQELRRETSLLANAQMQIIPLQGATLAMLAQLVGAKKYLEIGMFTGYSALWVAQALPTAEIITLDISDVHLPLAQKYWSQAGVATNIEVKIAPATTTLQQLQNESQLFDMAFIDANKAEYLDYYELCLQLIRPGGLIVIDNVLMYGQVLETNPDKKYVRVLQQLNDLIANDPRVEICMLPIGDGFTLARKKDNK